MQNPRIDQVANRAEPETSQNGRLFGVDHLDVFATALAPSVERASRAPHYQ